MKWANFEVYSCTLHVAAHLFTTAFCQRSPFESEPQPLLLQVFFFVLFCFVTTTHCAARLIVAVSPCQSEKLLLFDTVQSELEEKIRRLEEDRHSIDITSGANLLHRQPLSLTQTRHFLSVYVVKPPVKPTPDPPCSVNIFFTRYFLIAWREKQKQLLQFLIFLFQTTKV